MNNARKSLIDLSGYDWIAIGLCLLLMAIGWVMIFASEYNPDTYSGLINLDKSYGKQLLWVGGGILIIVGIQFVEGRFFQTFAFVFLGIAVLLLIAVLFTTPIHGSTSWFAIGSFRFQPSEYAKTATALSLAYLLSMPDIRMQSALGRAQALGLIGIPTFLVLLQGDAGSTLVFLSFLLVLFRAGLSSMVFIMGLSVIALSIAALMVDKILGIALVLAVVGNFILLRFWRKDERWSIGFGALALATYFLSNTVNVNLLLAVHLALLIALSILNLIKRNWQITTVVLAGFAIAIIYTSSVNYLVNKVLKPHQQERIWVWLRPEKCDPLGALYNLEQSKYAIGSGGVLGKGFLEGERTKLDYVPEQSTDFIFCTVGEEWGFFGSFFVITVFILLILRIFYIAERQRISFSKYYAYSVATIFLFHLFVNVGMTMGLLPVIGIPLPFVSYGGSSLFSFSLMIAILIKLDSERMTIFR